MLNSTRVKRCDYVDTTQQETKKTQNFNACNFGEMRESQRKKANKIALDCNFGKKNKAALMFQVRNEVHEKKRHFLSFVKLHYLWTPDGIFQFIDLAQ